MISKERVQYIAKLARLGLSEEETEKMQKELSLILDYFKLIDELDVSDTEPAFYVNPLKNVTREDEVKGCEKEMVDEMLKQAPEKEGRYIKVKEILK